MNKTSLLFMILTGTLLAITIQLHCMDFCKDDYECYEYKGDDYGYVNFLDGKSEPKIKFRFYSFEDATISNPEKITSLILDTCIHFEDLVAKCSNLRHLKLKSLILGKTTVPNPQKVESLIINFCNYNDLDSWPTKLDEYTNLKSLELRGMRLKDQSIPNAEELIVIFCKNIDWKSIPNPTKLRFFKSEGTDLTHIDFSIFTNLIRINIDWLGSQRKRIKCNWKKMAYSEKVLCIKLKYLDLEDLNFSLLPNLKEMVLFECTKVNMKSIPKLVNLEFLYFKDQDLDNIDFSLFPNVKKILVWYCNNVNWESLKKLTHLNYLQVYDGNSRHYDPVNFKEIKSFIPTSCKLYTFRCRRSF